MRLLARLFPETFRLFDGKIGLKEWEEDEDEDDEIDAVAELTHQQAVQWLRSPYALT